MRASALWLQLREVWGRSPCSDIVFCLHVPFDGAEAQPWTWQHVHNAVCAVHTALQPLLGQASVPHVATITHPGLEHTLAMLACLASGCVAVITMHLVCSPLVPGLFACRWTLHGHQRASNTSSNTAKPVQCSLAVTAGTWEFIVCILV